MRVIPPESQQDQRENRARDVKKPPAQASLHDKHRHDPVTKHKSTAQAEAGDSEKPQTYELKYDRATAGDKRLRYSEPVTCNNQ